MKFAATLVLVVAAVVIHAQSLQAHYDFRKSLEPKYNAKDFVTLYFHYFKSQDIDSAIISPGSFLMTMQGDLVGERDAIGRFYMQVSQSARFWTPKVFLSIQYSGGFGVSEPGSYGYYLANTYSVGVSYLFSWGEAPFSVSVSYMRSAARKPGNDVLCSLYWWSGFWQYRAEFLGDIQMWTQDRDRGDNFTAGMHGKRIAVYAEPQLWYSLGSSIAVGSKINMYYLVLTSDHVVQVYPTLAVKYKLN